MHGPPETERAASVPTENRLPEIANQTKDQPADIRTDGIDVQAAGLRHIGHLLPSIVDGIARRCVAFHLSRNDFVQANRIRIIAGLAWNDLLGLTERAA